MPWPLEGTPKHGTLLVLNPTPMDMFGGEQFPQHQETLLHQQGVLQFNSLLTLSTWREHQILQVQGSILQDQHPLQMSITNPDCHLYF